ncbi:PRC-barrel domain-containing protein [Brevibacillus dissolubilis]|uniref:PRC-barrel domain-containing protein n=1 Tax=Brevibacillus dissolubilis TaxID=1844116 RepID=UPI0011166F15|nr:PRC-barrel domain-containing protein [Brevibacillus dissolubilis]
MRRALDILGLPVLCLATGEKIGEVCDILCDLKSKVIGVVIQEAGWFQSGKYVPIAQIHAFGEDYLTVTGIDAITPMRQLDPAYTVGLVTGKLTIKGKPVITESGELLGIVEDVYFSSDWTKMVGYELSDGWIADVTEGRKRMPNDPPFTVGKESLIVPHMNRI